MLSFYILFLLQICFLSIVASYTLASRINSFILDVVVLVGIATGILAAILTIIHYLG